MRKWQKVLVIIFAVLVGLYIIKDPLVKSAVTTVGSNVVGAKLKIKKFSLGLFTQKVSIKGLQLYNPKGFPNEPLIDIPEITVQYDLPALIGGKLHLPLIVVDVKEMSVVKNKEGVLNVDVLKVAAQPEEKPKETEEQPKEKKESKAMAMQIDLMRLNVGQVIFKDYTKGEEPVITVYDVGLRDKEFKDITSAQQMATLIMVQAMGPTAIKGAKIYGAAAILGVGFLPAGVVGIMIGKDDSTADFDVKFDKAFAVALDVIKENGELKSEEKAKGTIKAKMDGADITIVIAEKTKSSVTITASARKMMLPKPEIAGGVIYKITEKLK